MKDPKLLDLLNIVIENYLCKWDPIGSKFLHNLEDVPYAPSTLRKYLNLLEQAGLVYQPYNSSGRIPTLEGISIYLSHYLDADYNDEAFQEGEVINTRQNMKKLVEGLWQVADGVVVWFLRNDEYYYLGINNLLRDDLLDEYQTTRDIISFIEWKSIVKFLDEKITKRNNVYHTFIKDKEAVISCIYAKVVLNDYDCMLSIIGPTRMNYKKNIILMRKLLKWLNKNRLHRLPKFD